MHILTLLECAAGEIHGCTDFYKNAKMKCTIGLLSDTETFTEMRRQ